MSATTAAPDTIRPARWPTPSPRWLDAVARRLAELHMAARDSGRGSGVHDVSAPGGLGGGGEAQSIDTSDGTAVHIEDAYREHAAAMYRTAVAIVRDHALAEDVVQDAIVKAWRHLDSYRGDAALKTWLLRITHNTAVSTLRRLRDTPLDPERMPHTPVAGPEDGTISDRFVEAFEAALFDLDETSRSAMALRELEGLPYADIAEILDLPLPTVKTRLFRARRRLANDLAHWRDA